MMTRRRHNRAPLRRSSTPEKILASGLAAAVCIGIVGVIGVRTIDNKSDEAATTEPAAPTDTTDDLTATTEALDTALTPVSTDGLTREQLDAYAAALAAEKHRLDVYRVKLIRAAKQLQGTTSVGATSVQAGTVDATNPEDAEGSDDGDTATTSSAPAPARTSPASQPAAQPAAQPVAAKPVVAKPAQKPAQSSTKSS